MACSRPACCRQAAGRRCSTACIHAGVNSGLRRAATGLLPSRRIPDFLSINATRREQAGCHPDNPFAMPAQCLTPAPPSFRRRPESSGLDKPFPRSGNDNRRDNRTRAFGQTCYPFTTAPPPSSAACSRPACCRQAQLYHGSAELAERPASMQAWIPAFACLLQAGRNDDSGKNDGGGKINALSKTLSESRSLPT